MAPCLFVSFHVTADAMATKLACERDGLDGKLVPVPRSMSAGCGMAWRCQVKNEERIRFLLEKEKIDWEKIQVI